MNTLVLSSSEIDKAAKLIRRSQLVAFPTETVYGLGANALDATAVAAIFTAKGRPLSNPLIVHCSSVTQVRSIAFLTPEAEMLAKAFWPGPLTMVLRKKSIVPDIVTARGATVAVRIPAHPIARKLIRIAGVPIAAPSANTFMHTSPTTAEHVLEDLDGKIAAVIKAGHATIGVESTVIDLTSTIPRVLRPGGLPFQQLKRVLPKVEHYRGHASEKSPGQHTHHYCPHATLVLVRSSSEVRRLIKNNPHPKAALMSYTEWLPTFASLPLAIYDWGSKTNMEQLAHRLYGGLRSLDDTHPDVIYCPLPKEAGLGQAIGNRLKKACGMREES